MSIYQHPLAYLLGIEGLALLQGWAGDHDREFTLARLTEVRQLLDDPVLARHPGVEVARGSAADGYRQWADRYDEPNGLFDFDEPFFDAVLASIPVGGDALDAACGTGRLAERLAGRGFAVVGVDSSPEMLGAARQRVPGAQFGHGDLERLPVASSSVDVVTCGLALSHLPSLGAVLTEFARVLRPGGHLIVSDVHHELIFRGSVVNDLGPTGEPGLVPTYRHSPGDYLRAALAVGFDVRACEEPHGVREAATGPDGFRPPAQTGLGDWAEWPFSLMDLLPAANRAASKTPFVINWHFQRAGGERAGGERSASAGSCQDRSSDELRSVHGVHG